MNEFEDEPEDDDELEPHSIVHDYGTVGVIWSGEGYFGTDWDAEYIHSEMCTVEEAQQWCLNRLFGSDEVRKEQEEANFN